MHICGCVYLNMLLYSLTKYETAKVNTACIFITLFHIIHIRMWTIQLLVNKA